MIPLNIASQLQLNVNTPPELEPPLFITLEMMSRIYASMPGTDIIQQLLHPGGKKYTKPWRLFDVYGNVK
jgi:hypothetical protein